MAQEDILGMRKRHVEFGFSKDLNLNTNSVTYLPWERLYFQSSFFIYKIQTITLFPHRGLIGTDGDNVYRMFSSFQTFFFVFSFLHFHSIFFLLSFKMLIRGRFDYKALEYFPTSNIKNNRT